MSHFIHCYTECRYAESRGAQINLCIEGEMPIFSFHIGSYIIGNMGQGSLPTPSPYPKPVGYVLTFYHDPEGVFIQGEY